VFGGQVGSEGKGAICGYMARRYRYGAAICSFMTNAGHTWVDGDEKVMVQQIPISLISPDVTYLLIGPGAGITVSTLLDEIQKYDTTYNVAARLHIDPRAVIIEDRHAQDGKEHSIARAGVGKGCGRANAEKSMRLPTAKLARNVHELKGFIGDTVQLVNSQLDAGMGVMVEGAQGFDLDLNHGIDYPYCTSRGTTPMQTLADCGIAAQHLRKSIAVVRSYPIRVGNIVEDGEQKGYSGFYGRELSWEEVAERSGAPLDLTVSERTTVTKRIRRVFEIDHVRLARMAMVCRPTEIALTFADYIDYNLKDTYGYGVPIGSKLARFVNAVEHTCNAPVRMVKTGADDRSVIHTHE